MKTATFVAIAAMSFALVGCASVDITKTASGFYNPTNPNDVQILKTRPERHYVELGTVTVTGYDSGDTAKEHNAIRAKAAALGSDAVILTEEGITPAGWGSYQRWATGVAIKFTP